MKRKNFSKIAVLGGGAFGIALAKLASHKSDEVALWARDKNVCTAINQHHHHPTKLSNIKLPSSIIATSFLKDALSSTEIVIVALPIKALGSVMECAKSFLEKKAIIVSTAKGIDENTFFLPHEILSSVLDKEHSERACFLSGPSFAIELALDLPTALTLASTNQEAALYFQEKFSSDTFRLYRSDDVVGVTVGGALKNVIAIASGAAAALGLGRNAMASLITRGLAEITRLAVAMGGRASTVSGLSGAGDLILSCTDDMSRNHRIGGLLVEHSLKEAESMIEGVVEGVKTAKTIPVLMKKFAIDLPISFAVYQVLYENVNVRDALASLLSRRLKDEGL